jgi:hypothetical protein
MEAEMVTTFKAGKQKRVMVWASFWGTGEWSKLFLLARDSEPKKHRYTTNSYIEALEAKVLEHYYDGLIFM